MFRRPLALLLLVTVPLMLTGCTAPRPRSLPTATGTADHPPVAVGDNVTVELRSGEVLTGEVLELADDHLVMGKPGNFGRQETPVPYADIATISVNKLTSGGTVAVAGVSVVLTFVILFLLGMSTVGADLS
jgi:hypothetical protein